MKIELSGPQLLTIIRALSHYQYKCLMTVPKNSLHANNLKKAEKFAGETRCYLLAQESATDPEVIQETETTTDDLKGEKE